MSNIQHDKVVELQEDWKKKGNLPCDHSSLSKEYILGMNTGDVVCDFCGKTFSSRDAARKSANK